MTSSGEQVKPFICSGEQVKILAWLCGNPLLSFTCVSAREKVRLPQAFCLPAAGFTERAEALLAQAAAMPIIIHMTGDWMGS